MGLTLRVSRRSSACRRAIDCDQCLFGAGAVLLSSGCDDDSGDPLPPCRSARLVRLPIKTSPLRCPAAKPLSPHLTPTHPPKTPPPSPQHQHHFGPLCYRPATQLTAKSTPLPLAGVRSVWRRTNRRHCFDILDSVCASSSLTVHLALLFWLGLPLPRCCSELASVQAVLAVSSGAAFLSLSCSVFVSLFGVSDSFFLPSCSVLHQDTTQRTAL